MVVRRRKKRNKMLGKRSHGKGNTKNKRGAGCRGGRGRAGSHKHKYSKYWMTFGVKKKLKPKPVPPAIKLDELCWRIDKWISEGKAEKRGGEIIVDGGSIGYGKVLGTGSIVQAVVLRNMEASAGAREKIENAGGRIEETAAAPGGEKGVAEKAGTAAGSGAVEAKATGTAGKAAGKGTKDGAKKARGK